MRGVTMVCALALVLAGGSGAAGPGARIAVATTQGRILLIDANGRTLSTLTRPAHSGVRDWSPAWSPDGTRIAFARTTDAMRSFHVYVMRADGSGVRRITSGRFDESPSWSPDGRRIAYAASDGIRVVRSDGTGSRRVPGTGASGARFATAYATHPSWAPGGRLSYSFHPEDPSDWPPSCDSTAGRCGWVITVRLDGGGRHAVVRGRDGHWSPDRRIVVYTPPDGGVATIPARGGRSKILGRGYEASWSADGRSIVYARLGNRPAGDSIWIMSARGGRPHRILTGATTPAWAPR